MNASHSGTPISAGAAAADAAADALGAADGAAEAVADAVTVADGAAVTAVLAFGLAELAGAALFAPPPWELQAKRNVVPRIRSAVFIRPMLAAMAPLFKPNCRTRDRAAEWS
jgi:hypothetical protein